VQSFRPEGFLPGIHCAPVAVPQEAALYLRIRGIPLPCTCECNFPPLVPGPDRLFFRWFGSNFLNEPFHPYYTRVRAAFCLRSHLPRVTFNLHVFSMMIGFFPILIGLDLSLLHKRPGSACMTFEGSCTVSPKQSLSRAAATSTLKHCFLHLVARTHRTAAEFFLPNSAFAQYVPSPADATTWYGTSRRVFRVDR